MAVLCWSLPKITQTSREGAGSPPSCPSSTPSNPSGPSQNHGQAGFPVFHSSSPSFSVFTLGRAHGGPPRGTSGREPSCQCRRHKIRAGFNPWVRKSPWRRHGKPLQYSVLETPMDRGAVRLHSVGSVKSDDRSDAVRVVPCAVRTRPYYPLSSPHPLLPELLNSECNNRVLVLSLTLCFSPH